MSHAGNVGLFRGYHTPSSLPTSLTSSGYLLQYSPLPPLPPLSFPDLQGTPSTTSVIAALFLNQGEEFHMPVLQ